MEAHIVYDDRMSELETDTILRIAQFARSHGFDYHAAAYTKEGRRAAAKLFWDHYFETEVKL
jgi:hypothetical protein